MVGPRFWTTPLSLCHLIVALLFLHGSVLFQADAGVVEMKFGESQTLCLYLQWNVNFSIQYETENNEYKRADFGIPDDADYTGSDCGDDYGNIIAVKFGKDNHWNLSFIKSGDAYEGFLSFTYNTNDTQLFPDAKRKGPVTVTTKYPEQQIQLNTVFRCDGLNSLQTENVTQYMWEVTLEAFIPAGLLSESQTHCSQDVPPTTEQLETTMEATPTSTIPSETAEEPTIPSETAEEPTTPMTQTTPTTPTTTMAPAPVTTTPSGPFTTLQPWARPAAGTYSVKDNGTICLLATMALQLNISEKTEAVLFNINPNATEASGICGNSTSSLTLKEGNKEITFGFAVRNTTNEVFYLKEVKITMVDDTNVTHTVANLNLNSWEASLGSSYLCHRESVLQVTPFYKLNVNNLQVQPFDVRDDQFSTAEECYNRQFRYLVVIIVAAVVAFLLFVVFIIYISRRKKREPDPFSV